MPELETVSMQGGLLIGAIAVGLVVVSVRFNAWIDKQDDVDPLGGNSATYTVLGVAYTLLGALFVLAILVGWTQALLCLGVVLVTFAVSGTPMIIGNMLRAGKRRRDAARDK